MILLPLVHLFACFSLGSIFFLFDEPIHLKRGLLYDERLSHLFDLICFTALQGIGWLSCLRESSDLSWLYLAQGLFTLLCSLKDELLHFERSPSWQENLTHAGMFLALGVSVASGFNLLGGASNASLFFSLLLAGLMSCLWLFYRWFFRYETQSK